MSAQSAVSKMSLATTDAQPEVPISITVIDDGDLTVTVSPRHVKLTPGRNRLKWSIASNAGWVISSISGSGISADVDGDGVWRCSFPNNLTADDPVQYFPYTIYLTKIDSNPPMIAARIGVDPVIENDPPPPSGV